MSKKITCQLNIQVSDGPQLSESKVVDVEAYDFVEVTIPAGTTTTAKKISVQPGTPAKVQVLLIKSTEYGDQLTFSVPDGTTQIEVPLEGPQLLVGKAAEVLLKSPLESLPLKNGMAKDATITILVGRTAIS